VSRALVVRRNAGPSPKTRSLNRKNYDQKRMAFFARRQNPALVLAENCLEVFGKGQISQFAHLDFVGVFTVS
jgi:hypothetical protein